MRQAHLLGGLQLALLKKPLGLGVVDPLLAARITGSCETPVACAEHGDSRRIHERSGRPPSLLWVGSLGA